jgi:predicted deacylase
MARESFGIGNVRIRAGTARALELPITRLVTGSDVSLPVRVIHGREDGPTIWVDAAIHGDEVVGVEVIRQVMADLDPRAFRGTLIAVPIVNVLGFMTGDRYLPDRRDLNRSFPGSARGSLASRIAHLFMHEVVAKCEVGIDLHTGSDRRSNLPQVRADLDDERTRAVAEAFGAPLMLHARLRDGSLREAATQAGMAMLLFEGGEDNRYDDYAIDCAYDGVRRVLALLEMLDGAPGTSGVPVTSRESRWVRAQRGGLLRAQVELGDRVESRQVLGHLSDIFGRGNLAVRAPFDGIVIGQTRSPLTNQGDALFHIAAPEPAGGPEPGPTAGTGP